MVKEGANDVAVVLSSVSGERHAQTPARHPGVDCDKTAILPQVRNNDGYRAHRASQLRVQTEDLRLSRMRLFGKFAREANVEGARWTKRRPEALNSLQDLIKSVPN
jgi:hypothetical protein